MEDQKCEFCGCTECPWPCHVSVPGTYFNGCGKCSPFFRKPWARYVPLKITENEFDGKQDE
jgi:ribosome-binding protein aMBF1 (putative translation factor)